MFDNKVNVRLTDTCASHTPLFPHNRITVQEAENYADHFIKYKKIPKQSCLYYVQLYYCKHTEVLTYIGGVTNGRSNNLAGTDNGDLKLCINCKCPMGACFDNMANGKCTDAFAREIICEKLFKDKYSEQR